MHRCYRLQLLIAVSNKAQHRIIRLQAHKHHAKSKCPEIQCHSSAVTSRNSAFFPIYMQKGGTLFAGARIHVYFHSLPKLGGAIWVYNSALSRNTEYWHFPVMLMFSIKLDSIETNVFHCNIQAKRYVTVFYTENEWVHIGTIIWR